MKFPLSFILWKGKFWYLAENRATLFTYRIFIYTGGPRLVRHLCQKLLKNRTIVNLGQAHTSISANFPQNTALIKISPKIALFEVPVEPYKNRTISRIALIKWRTNQGFPVLPTNLQILNRFHAFEIKLVYSFKI